MSFLPWCKRHKFISIFLLLLAAATITTASISYALIKQKPEEIAQSGKETSKSLKAMGERANQETEMNDDDAVHLEDIDIIDATSPKEGKVVVAWQPSHQDDTGANWHEYLICSDIVDRTIAKATSVTNVKCWDTAHGLTGSNNYRPNPTNLIAFDTEVEQANRAGASYFISIHNDGGAPSGILGEYLPGDEAGKKLAESLVNAICSKTGLPNRGLRAVRLYSLESSRNSAQYKCLLEIGDNEKDRAFLENSHNRDLVAQAIAEVVNSY